MIDERDDSKPEAASEAHPGLLVAGLVIGGAAAGLLCIGTLFAFYSEWMIAAVLLAQIAGVIGLIRLHRSRQPRGFLQGAIIGFATVLLLSSACWGFGLWAIVGEMLS